jgi:putative ABC transport system permease protein
MRVLASLRSVVSALFHRSRVENEMDAELRAHIEDRINDLERSGIARAEAERRARLEFGGYEKFKEECREAIGAHFIETMIQDVRYGLRMLRKSPGFTAVAVLTLALGIGATTAIFSVVDAVLIRDLPFRDPARLVALFQTPDKMTGLMGWAADGPDILDWQRDSHSFSGIAASLLDGANITGGRIPQHVNGEKVTANYFDLLGVQAAIGRTFSPSDEQTDQKEVVMSYALWRTSFGGQDILGRSIALDGEPFTVIGIMPASYRDPRTWSNPQSNYWILLPQSQLAANRGEHMYASFGRLKPNTTVAQAQQEMNVIAARDAKAFPNSNEGFGVRVSPLDQVNLQVFEGGHFESVGPAILLLQLAAGFLLLVACANIASLMLSQSLKRYREFAVRAAMGAGRGRIIRQLLTESLLLSTAGGPGGALLAVWCAKILLALAPKDYLPPTANVQIDLQVLAFAVGIATLTGILFGLFPALRASCRNLSEDLKATALNSGNAPSRLRVRRALVAFELAATFVLLIAGGLMVRSLASLLSVNPGFDPDNFLTAELSLPSQEYAKPMEIIQFFSRVQQCVAAVPGVISVGLTSAPEFGVTSASDVIIEGEPVTKNSTVGVWPQICVITPNFFRAAGIPLMQGRDFSFSDIGTDSHVAIISQSFASHFWPHQDPLGKHLRCCGISGWVDVVGVVGDVHQQGLDAASRPELYFPLIREMADGQNAMNIVVRSSLPPTLVGRQISRQVSAVDAAIPLSDTHTGRQILDDWSGSLRYRATLLASFGAMALFLAAIGLFGTISYATAQRTHEIGLRMALGAQRGDVFQLIILEGLKLTLIGLVVGLTGGLVLTRWMANLIYGIAASDPLTFASVATVLTFAALLACYVPARRAMKVDPMVALRHE